MNATPCPRREGAAYRLGLVVEQSLGHGTHARNLAAFLETDPTIEPAWVPVAYAADDAWERLPLVRKNWSLRGGLRALAALRACLRAGGPVDALLFHTQITALCAAPLLRDIPCVVSLDATPLNMDTVGAAYSHRPDGEGPLARLKRRWNATALRAATAVVAWSDWARASAVHDYGVDPARAHVIPPGVDTSTWRPGPQREHGGPLRLLFVGGDFARKGGHDLVAAVRALAPRCELDVVSRDPAAPPQPGVRVHRDLAPNDERLRALFRRADAFVLPTRGDCTPLVLLEAMASGLPVISTRVGAISEQVVDGVTGLLVAPGDRRALRDAVEALHDPVRRRSFGAAGRARAEALFDARTNYGRLVTLLKGCADAARERRRTEAA